jgi:hypothetical protein
MQAVHSCVVAVPVQTESFGTSGLVRDRGPKVAEMAVSQIAEIANLQIQDSYGKRLSLGSIDQG